MTTTPSTPDPDELLGYADWVRALARRLVLDESRADDVVQETWIAALEQPPRDNTNLRGWFSTVVRNTARRIGRSEKRRSRREAEVARAEPQPSTADLAERAAMQRDLVDRVLQIDEPYRSVLLLRYFDDLPPRKIAARLSIPIATVRTRLARGHEQLRAKLTSDFGDRRSWCIALLPLAGGTRALKAAASGSVATWIGGIMAMSTWKVCAAAAVVIGLGSLCWDLVTEPRLEMQRIDADSRTSADLRDLEHEKNAPTDEQQAGNERIAASAPTPSVIDRSVTPVLPLEHGRLLDAEGKPLAGIALVGSNGVSLRPEATKALLMDREAKGEKLDGRDIDRLLTIETDATGRFDFEKGDDAKHARAVGGGLFILGGGYSQDGELLLIAAPTIDISGVVVDEGGLPIGEASVQVLAYVDALQTLPIVLRSTFGGVQQGSERTDGQGGFALEHVPTVLGATLQASRRGYRSACLPLPGSSTVGICFVLHDAPADEEWVVSGRVLDALGNGAEDARVHLGGNFAETNSSGEFRLAIQRATPDVYGVSTGERSRAARYSLIAVKKGCQAAVIEGFGARLQEASERENVVLRLGGEALEIRGRVVDAGGAPQPNFVVSLLDPTSMGNTSYTPEWMSSFSMRPVITDSEGRFVIDGLRDRAYRLMAFDIRTLLCIHTDPIRSGRMDVVVKLPEHPLHGHLSGRVVSRHGIPVVGASLSVALDSESEVGVMRWNSGSRTSTDAQGRFELSDVPREHVCLTVTGVDLEDHVLELGPSTPETGLEIVVERTCRFRVERRPLEYADGFRVLDGSGTSVGIATINAGGKSYYEIVPIGARGSELCAVRESAATLVLLHGKDELRRVPLDLDPDEMRVITP